MIPDSHRNNFHQLERAFENGDAALLECEDKEGNPVYTICIMVEEEDGGFRIYPLARMFTYKEGDDPLVDLVPPEGAETVLTP